MPNSSSNSSSDESSSGAESTDITRKVPRAWRTTIVRARGPLTTEYDSEVVTVTFESTADVSISEVQSPDFSPTVPRAWGTPAVRERGPLTAESDSEEVTVTYESASHESTSEARSPDSSPTVPRAWGTTAVRTRGPLAAESDSEVVTVTFAEYSQESVTEVDSEMNTVDHRGTPGDDYCSPGIPCKYDRLRSSKCPHCNTRDCCCKSCGGWTLATSWSRCAKEWLDSLISGTSKNWDSATSTWFDKHPVSPCVVKQART